MLTGEMLLDSTQNGNRRDELQRLHEDLDLGCFDLLKAARGQFSLVYYNPSTRTVTLIADKLGLRCLYYSIGPDRVVFASALRIIEALPDFPKKVDLGGLAEIAALGHCLGTRTPYADTFMLGPAEIVQISQETIRSRQYFHWDGIAVSHRSELQSREFAFQQFLQAISHRVRNDHSTIAFLSGGLDSRSVVAALRQRGTNVHTFTFGHPGTQDFALGAEVAKALGTIHTQVRLEPGPWFIHRRLRTAWENSVHRRVLPPERPEIVWSGEGGSVGLGHESVNSAVIALLRVGNLEAAADRLVPKPKAQICQRLLRSNVVGDIGEYLRSEVLQELSKLRCEDPGRAAYLFLMLNQQRRKLAWHFELMDLEPLEFHLPFFDSEFLGSIIGIPIDLCLFHRFYNNWLNLFPTVVTSIPWQAYPGHEPSRLPPPHGLDSQWLPRTLKLNAPPKSGTIAKVDAALRDQSVRHLLDTRYVRAAKWAYATGLRDTAHILSAVCVYHKYLQVSSGEYVQYRENNSLG